MQGPIGPDAGSYEPGSCFYAGLFGGGVCGCPPHKEVVGLGVEKGEELGRHQKLSGCLLLSSHVARCTVLSQVTPRRGGCFGEEALGVLGTFHVFRISGKFHLHSEFIFLFLTAAFPRPFLPMLPSGTLSRSPQALRLLANHPCSMQHFQPTTFHNPSVS